MRRISGCCVSVTGSHRATDRFQIGTVLVRTYDEKPKRRVFDVLQGQGMQSNQSVTFLPDGGDDVREVR